MPEKVEAANGAITNSLFPIPGRGHSPRGPGRRGGRWPGHLVGQHRRRRRQRRSGIRPEGRRHHPRHRLRVLADAAGRRRKSRPGLRHHRRNVRADVGDGHRRAGAAGGELGLPRGRCDRHRAQLERGAERVDRRGPQSRDQGHHRRHQGHRRHRRAHRDQQHHAGEHRPVDACASCSPRRARPRARCSSNRSVAGIEGQPGSRCRVPGGLGGEVPEHRLRRCRATTTTTSVPPPRRSTTRSRRIPIWSEFSPTTTAPVSARRPRSRTTTPRTGSPSWPSTPTRRRTPPWPPGRSTRLVVQNPYFLGYQGVIEAAMATQGGIPPAILDPGAAIADKDNMDDPEVKSLLEPPTAKAGG